MSAVVNFVSNAVSAVGNAVGKVVNFVGKTVVNTVKDAIKNPVRTIATIAAYALAPATGGLSLTIGLPLISAADTIAKGGNIGQALLAAGASYAASAIGGSDFVSNALTDTVGAGIAKDMIQGAIRGSISSGLQGGDIASGALSGAAAAGIGNAIGDFGVKDYLGATLGATAGAVATNALSRSLTGGLNASLKGKSFEEGAAQGASSSVLGGFMDSLSNLGGSAKTYFGDLYKSQVEPLYNAQVSLQDELSNKGAELQELQDEYRSAYDSYNTSAEETQKYADDYNAKSAEFTDLKSQYDAAVSSGNTEEADRLADLANAKAEEADKVHVDYEKSLATYTTNETAVTDLQNKYLADSEALKTGVLSYQENLKKLQEVTDPLTQAQERAQQNWYKTVGSDATGAMVDEKTFGDGTKIQIFDDGSQIVIGGGKALVYNDDGSLFTPSGQEAIDPESIGSNEAINYGKQLFNTLASQAKSAPSSGRLRSADKVFGSAARNNAASGRANIATGVGVAGIAGPQSGGESAVRSANTRVNPSSPSDATDGSYIEGNTNYNLGYETEYGKGLNAKQIAIPGINAPQTKPEDQYLTFGADQAVVSPNEKERGDRFDYLSFANEPEAAPTMKRGGVVSRETIEREAPIFMSEGSLNRRRRQVKGEGDGTSDDVPALLARDEYVLSADVVSALGNGSSDAGAERLDKFVEAIRSHKRKAAPAKLAPDAKEIHQYFRGGLA